MLLLQIGFEHRAGRAYPVLLGIVVEAGPVVDAITQAAHALSQVRDTGVGGGVARGRNENAAPVLTSSCPSFVQAAILSGIQKQGGAVLQRWERLVRVALVRASLQSKYALGGDAVVPKDTSAAADAAMSSGTGPGSSSGPTSPVDSI
jgi:hypothetical protein